ncbi:hypothetical protein BBI17_003793 [Phytophthora kernoviae]|nr:hypothetical protein G195_005611 [Phytophthora kernoviae 00238/432]KAG2524717.1 hypothetical protein JM16_004857 [Phytophthora kernoviae]KAG2526413.1 hypothetical protein JM18_004395 [Phytophthora kernoviae]RLM96205.1 hypothetical protein BBI17_003793 [Phytophthora kernoviae]
MEDKSKDSALRQSEEAGTSNANGEIETFDTAQFIQTGEVGIFMCDMRSTPTDDAVTCNNRLLTPLTRQERPIIGEKQWLYLEKALKKKSVMAFVLCLEFPLILTDATHIDAMREDASNSGVDHIQEEASGRWKLYDRQTIFQHWVSCRRQLEQLLTLLFRWKAKRRGREIVVLSGGMRVGLDTLLQDRETQLSIRSLTAGPLTARVEPSFDDMPLEGTACPTFIASESQLDEQFTFSHSLITSKNYLLTHIGITRELVDQPGTSDEEVTALTRYLHNGREFTAALEVLFEKHQFAEAARMEELRSKHRRRQRGPEELRASLRAVFTELWKVLPDAHRRQVAYFQDEFVFDFLLGYLAPTLFEDDSDLDDDAERPPLEFAAFSTLCRDFIFNSCVLHLSLRMHQEDERKKITLQRADAQRQASERAAQRVQQQQEQAEEAAKLEKLRLEDPEAYARRMLAEQEQALREKRAKVEGAREQRKAEKMRDVEEELAIAKEQRKLDKLAESGDQHEYQHRRELLAVRARKLQERKRHREAEEARRREKKEKKKKEHAAQQ